MTIETATLYVAIHGFAQFSMRGTLEQIEQKIRQDLHDVFAGDYTARDEAIFRESYQIFID